YIYLILSVYNTSTTDISSLSLHDALPISMRPGSKSPLDARDSKDLGRFWLGLKTASFSQCRRLSVLSKKTNSAPVFWTWDLDFRSEEHTSELQSRENLVCRLLLEKKNRNE